MQPDIPARDENQEQNQYGQGRQVIDNKQRHVKGEGPEYDAHNRC